jgi:glyoxylase-like metal-dependent hydrolase (beta-lactamase superfamily II)
MREVQAAPAREQELAADRRHPVRWAGQAWTDADALGRDHRLRIADDHGVPGLDVQPPFAIGQRACVVEAEDGAVLWDCVSLVTEEAVALLRERRVRAIAISHPHYYTAMGSWSDALGGVPVHLHADDAAWVMRPHPAIRFWEGEALALGGGLTLIRCGGHFAGATVLHRAGGGGDLFVGDVLQVRQDRAGVSFMRSYPNHIPLGPAALDRIERALAPFAYERVHGAFREKSIARDGTAAVARSLARYRAAIAT